MPCLFRFQVQNLPNHIMPCLLPVQNVPNPMSVFCAKSVQSHNMQCRFRVQNLPSHIIMPCLFAEQNLPNPITVPCLFPVQNLPNHIRHESCPAIGHRSGWIQHSRWGKCTPSIFVQSVKCTEELFRTTNPLF